MEWLLCELCLQNADTFNSPSYWFQMFRQFREFKTDKETAEALDIVFTVLTETPGLLHEKEIVQFFVNIIENIDLDLSLIHYVLSNIYLDNTDESLKLIRLFATKYLKATYFTDRVVLGKMFNITENQTLLYNLSLTKTDARLMIFSKDEIKLNVEDLNYPESNYNPIAVRNILNTPELTQYFIDDVRSSLILHENHIPFLNEILPMVEDGDLAGLCVSLPAKSQNLYALLQYVKTWRPSTIFAKTCKQDLIRSTPIEYIQVMFAHMACWWSSDMNPCHSCTLNWEHFLPQWRCTALCVQHPKKEKYRCERFARPGSLYCEKHIFIGYQYHVKSYSTSNTPGSDPANDAYNTVPQKNDMYVRYPLTLRIVTSLSAFEPWRNSGNPDGFYLPVIRYESLYYSTSQDTEKLEFRLYCGKFFFYEPDSNVFLHLKNAQIYASKVHAVMDLHDKYWNKFGQSPSYLGPMVDEITSCMSNTFFWNDEFDYLSDKFVFHFLTPFLSYKETTNAKYNSARIPIFYPTEPSNVAGLQHSMGDFDRLDQPICNMAQELGYDVLVFQHEMGGHDCVTELMITRPEKETSLLYVIDNISTNIQEPQDVYPKLWFPGESGIVVAKDNRVWESDVITHWDEIKSLMPPPFVDMVANIEKVATPIVAMTYTKLEREPFGTTLKQRQRITQQPKYEEEEFEKFT